MSSGGRNDDSGSVPVGFAVIALVLGLGLETRALFHIVWHGETSFLADGMKALLVLGLGLLLWKRRTS